ncbi:MAG: hypothetical protein QOD26_2589 [Betaproteobacteria bacterium]|jgi:phage tail tape-measure protein|nr:hypothetical protein [Betaproteobacteria bacterium]
MRHRLEARAADARPLVLDAAAVTKGFLALSAVVLAGCATIPDGPGVMVLPGSTKSFDQFRADDADCRQYSNAQVGGKTANKAAVDSGVASAAVGTAVGAAAGGLIGGSSGAAIGAGVGLAGGALVGADAGNSSGRSLQQRYDFAFQQCMYARGHQIPMARGSMPRQQQRQTTAPPPPPPPPAGTPPPPPPGYRVN